MAHVRVASRLASFLAAFSALFLAAPLFADSQARIVRLSDVEGNVQIDRRTGEGFESALENLPVLQGTRISTKDDGRAEIEFEDGSTVRLAPNSSIEFTRLSLHDSGGKNTELEVSEGTAYFNINPGKRDDFTVDVGQRSIKLEREARFRATVDQSQAHIAVRHGQVDLSGQGSETVSVSKGKTASFDLLDQDSYSVAHDYEEEPYDEWNQNLEDYHSRNFHPASNETPYAYGFSDLNYYGGYISDPSFGSCWRPYFAGYSWDPFSAGTWVWYPGAGYTWVSSYPWGWAPYRYGSWNFAQASGWCWQPGAWNQWASLPTFGRPLLGYKPPVPPTDGHGRVPRIREAVIGAGPVAGSGGSRFGDPTRRVVREGLDGGVILPSLSARGEAGLGIPRGHVNLRNLPNATAPDSRGYIGDQRDGGRRSGGGGSSGSPQPGRSSGQSSAPRSSPAPRMSPPPPPPRPPAPAPRGGKGL
jgi:FecR protein